MTALALLDPQPVPAPLDRFDATALAERINQARHLLDAGDMRAVLVSEGAYGEARAAHAFATRMKASEGVISRAHAMVIEALEIGSLAKVALANEYDRAQAAGVVASRGRPKKVMSQDLFRLEDFGLDKQVMLDARKLRDAELKQPGIIRRAIAGISAQGVLPTKNNLRAAIGTASASKEERGDNFYQTPDVATIALLAFESFTSTIWEPACGKGAISRVLESHGYDVMLSDLVDRGTISEAGDVQAVGDFLLSRPEGEGECPDIVTNPPYGGVLNAFVAHALRVHKPRKIALLLNLNFKAGFADDDRSFVMDECPPSRVYVFKRRLPMMHREGYDGPKAESRMNTAWFVWERNDDGTYGDPDGWTRERRIDWMEFADTDALEPGEGGHSLGVHFDDAPRTTPKLELHERVDRDREDARTWILQRDEFSRAELCSGIGRRDSTVEAILSEFVADGLISAASEPSRHGRHVVLAKINRTVLPPGCGDVPALCLDPIVSDLITQDAPVAIGVSGGKDSQAAAIATVQHLDGVGHTGPRLLVHADLGAVEWNDSLAVCEDLARRLGLELLVVRRAAGDLMERWEARWRSSVDRYQSLSTVTLVPCWSTPKMRFCTSEMKTHVIRSALKKRFGAATVVNVTGVRRLESSARSKCTAATVETGAPLVTWRPIADWTVDEVFAAIDRAGMQPHVAYREFGMSRVSCRFCIMSSLDDLLAAANQDESHELLRRMVALECDSGFAFQGSRWLGDVAPQVLGEGLVQQLAQAKEKAALRASREARITTEMLYVKGWPTRMLTDDEADLLADVRREVTQLYGFQPGYLTRDEIHHRYAELIEARDRKGACT